MRIPYVMGVFLVGVGICSTVAEAEEHGTATAVAYSIVRFGAVGDGKTSNTASIQRTIDAVVQEGGGRVVVPPGRFLSGSIVLRTGVELRLEMGGELLGSTNPSDYKRHGGHPGFIVAENARNVSVSGPGTIDGQGLQLALAIDSLYRLGQFEDPKYNHNRARPSEEVRARLLDFSGCSGVVVRGVTLRNSAGWVEVFTECRRVLVDSVSVVSLAFWNNDGIDLCGCSDVAISNCFINSADDGICLKSLSRPSSNDNVSISNCRIRSSASAIKLGTESWGASRNIRIKDIVVYDTYRSAVAIECVDGGTVENVDVSDVVAENTGNAIFIRLGHRNPDDTVGVVRNISVRNVKADIPFGRPDLNYDLRGPDVPTNHNPFPASITGIAGSKVENVTLSNIEITYSGRGTKGMAYVPLTDLDRVPEAEKDYPEYSMFGELPAWGVYVRHVEGLTICDMTLRVRENDYRPACVFDDVVNLGIASCEIQTRDGDQAMVLRNVRKADIHSTRVDGQEECTVVKLGRCESVEVR